MNQVHTPVSLPVALTIAGSDSGGGAGMQADLKTMTRHRVFGTSVVTATTAQHTRGVDDVHPIPPAHVRAQYDAVAGDFAVSAVKTGMLATAEIVNTVTTALDGFDGPVVVDPVMVAASGDRLLSPAAEDAYLDLIEGSTLVTPNVDEAAVLLDTTIDTPADVEQAGRALVDHGVDAALITGGHLDADGDHAASTVTDTLVAAESVSDVDGDGTTVRQYVNPRVATDATHGSGCTLSTAITARLARGESLHAEVTAAVNGMSEAIRRGYAVGQGPGAVNPARLDSA